MLYVDRTGQHGSASGASGAGKELVSRLLRAKAAYTTRHVDFWIVEDITRKFAPRSGDLVLAKVEKIGQHPRVELATGRRAALHVGDEIVVCYGNRYAPDQFEAFVPDDLGPCHLVAAGGIAAQMLSKHQRMQQPTIIRPIGLLADESGRPMNLADWALPKPGPAETESRPLTIGVFGTMMNSGKTTCAQNLVLGLKRAGLRVGAVKVTGTGAGGDRWALVDAGADVVMDFTDVGVPSTFGLDGAAVQGVFTELMAHMTAHNVDAVVIEVADGLQQQETAVLANSDVFRRACHGVVFAAGDAFGAAGGVERLRSAGHAVIAASGILTCSPLAVRETEALIDVPVLTAAQLAAGVWLTGAAGAWLSDAVAGAPFSARASAETGAPVDVTGYARSVANEMADNGVVLKLQAAR